jgi:hypothetical protein
MKSFKELIFSIDIKIYVLNICGSFFRGRNFDNFVQFLKFEVDFEGEGFKFW